MVSTEKVSRKSTEPGNNMIAFRFVCYLRNSHCTYGMIMNVQPK